MKYLFLISWSLFAIDQLPDDKISKCHNLIVNNSGMLNTLKSISPVYKTIFAKFNECNCGLFSRSNRNQFENLVLDDITSNFSRDEEITVGSFSSGELQQEFILANQLIAKGYRKIKFIFIDPIYINKDYLTNFHSFINRLNIPELLVSTLAVPDAHKMHEMVSKNPEDYKLDVLLLIHGDPQAHDFELISQSSLKDAGRLYIFDNGPVGVNFTVKNKNGESLHDQMVSCTP